MPRMLGKAAYSTPCVSYIFFLIWILVYLRKVDELTVWISDQRLNSQDYNVSQMSVHVL